MKKGVIVRHLVLPNHSDDSIKVLDHLNNTFGNNLLLSLMSQYVVMNLSDEYNDIKRVLKPIEYKRVLFHTQSLGFDGFMQELSSSNTKYIPNFNLDGVKKIKE